MAKRSPRLPQFVESVLRTDSRVARTMQIIDMRDERTWPDTVASLRLSRREADIVDCLLDFDDDENVIARRLGISKHTVHAHLHRLYTKLQVRSRCQLVVRIFTIHLARQRPNSVSVGLSESPE